VRIEIADFDRWDATESGFDVVFAATAFHWLDPVTKFDRTAELLRPGGVLATVTPNTSQAAPPSSSATCRSATSATTRTPHRT